MKYIKYIRGLLVIALMALLLCFALPALAEGDGETIYRALLIGNENYGDAQVSGCMTDGNRMLGTLQSANEAGGRYLSPITRTNLTAGAMKELVAETRDWGADNDDVTLFYYAGLAMVTDEGAASLTGCDGEAYRLADLRTALDQVAGTKIVVLDCRYLESVAGKSQKRVSELLNLFVRASAQSFSGGATDGKFQLISSITMLESAKAGAAAIGTACGPFTYYLTQGCGYDYNTQKTIELLADTNLNYAVSLAEARDYVSAKLAQLREDGGLTLENDITIYPTDGAYPLFSKRATTEVLSVTLDQPALSVAAGRTATLTATVLPQRALQQEVFWISSDLGICTVSEDGTVTGVRPGSASITCIAPNGMATECQVMVRDVTFADSVSLNASKLVVGSGQTQLLALELKPSNSNELVTWKTSDSSVATVDSSGSVTPIRIGSAVITATTESGKEVSCVVQVVDPENVVSSIALEKNEISIYEGEAQLIATSIKPARAIDTTIAWSSSDDSVAQAESNGLIVGLGEGQAVITATASSGVTAELQVTVKGATIKLKHKSLSLKIGKKGKMGYAIEPSGSLMEVAWDSSDPSIATVSQEGEIETFADGETLITATLSNGQQASCRLAVATVPVKGMKISKDKLTMTPGDTYQMLHKLSPANASVKTVRWSSNNEDVATIDEDGLITATGVGTAKIIGLAHNNKGAKCIITVNPPKIQSVTLNSTSEQFRLGVDETFQLSATIEPESPLGNRAIKWKSTDEKVASVNADGLVTIKGEGQATIKCGTSKVVAECKIVVTTNRTVNKKAQYGSERKVYASLRQLAYADDKLLIQMYFVNRTKKAAYIPTPGVLKLTLNNGESYELMEISGKNSTSLASGDQKYISFHIELSENPELADLDLTNAKVELLPSSSED